MFKKFKTFKIFKLFKSKKFWLIVIIVLVLVGGVLVIFHYPPAWLEKKISFLQPTYYAVHLNNGQVYFGRIKSVNAETIKLANVYYLEGPVQAQASQTPGQEFQVQPTTQTVYNFVKRGSNNPLLTNNVLFINRSVVLFWEKLKPDSDIVNWIKQGQAQK
jgi:preprotein translocase subunit SecF